MNDIIGPEDERYYRELINQVRETSNPPPKLTAALRTALEIRPELYRDVFDISRQTQQKMIENVVHVAWKQSALEAQLEDMRRGMDYDNAPALVQGLIENVINQWIRLQLVEKHQANNEGSHVIAELVFWEQCHSASMRRYLQACETLARVRKITIQTLQVNIAQPGSQQVNVAGDLVKS